MNDDKLKIILALLSGIVFGLIFILLAFVLPLRDEPGAQKVEVQLRKISQQIKDNTTNLPPPDRP